MRKFNLLNSRVGKYDRQGKRITTTFNSTQQVWPVYTTEDARFSMKNGQLKGPCTIAGCKTYILQIGYDVSGNPRYGPVACRSGAPYRAPIAGNRKTLVGKDCCETGNQTVEWVMDPATGVMKPTMRNPNDTCSRANAKSSRLNQKRKPTNTIYKDNYSKSCLCISKEGKSIVEICEQTVIISQTPPAGILVGDHIAQSDSGGTAIPGGATGILVSVNEVDPALFHYGVELTTDCDTNHFLPGFAIFTTGAGVGQPASPITVSDTVVVPVVVTVPGNLSKETACACYDRRIRSGMQPKPNICMRWEGSGNTRRLVKKTLCPGDYGFQKAYSYSYSQYNKNRVCNTYERGLEKYVTPAHIDRTKRSERIKSSVCNHMYRKSGCNGCVSCCPDHCRQKVTGDPSITYTPQVGDVLTGSTSGAVGTILNITGSQDKTLEMRLLDCDKFFLSGDDLHKSPSEQFPVNAVGPVTDHPCTATELKKYRSLANSITVYKPSNKKFSVQGAVSGSSRLERLKLDTIKYANSKCRNKDARCETRGICGEKYGKGPYFAGKPRFTGWMFNSCHPETVCMNKTRQQPFGIPQLTKRGRQVRSNRLHGVDPTVKGKGKGLLPRGQYNRRAPGCKCPKVAGECVDPCCQYCTVLKQYGQMSGK